MGDDWFNWHLRIPDPQHRTQEGLLAEIVDRLAPLGCRPTSPNARDSRCLALGPIRPWTTLYYDDPYPNDFTAWREGESIARELSHFVPLLTIGVSDTAGIVIEVLHRGAALARAGNSFTWEAFSSGSFEDAAEACNFTTDQRERFLQLAASIPDCRCVSTYLAALANCMQIEDDLLRTGFWCYSEGCPDWRYDAVFHHAHASGVFHRQHAHLPSDQSISIWFKVRDSFLASHQSPLPAQFRELHLTQPRMTTDTAEGAST